jgi:hypothetical protein
MNTVWAGTAALALGASVAVAGALGGPSGASAAPPRAKVSVTITAEQVDLSGTVSSSKPVKCAANRTVSIFEQIGGRGGGDDEKRFSDTTSLQGGKYVWSTGNTGEEGFFYAVVAPKPGCKGASSPTVHAVRNED